MQVDMLKLLYDKLSDLHTLFANTPHEHRFPRPLFKVRACFLSLVAKVQGWARPRHDMARSCSSALLLVFTSEDHK